MKKNIVMRLTDKNLEGENHWELNFRSEIKALKTHSDKIYFQMFDGIHISMSFIETVNPIIPTS